MDLNKRFAQLTGIPWNESGAWIRGEDGFKHWELTFPNPDFAADPREVLKVMGARKDWLAFHRTLFKGIPLGSILKLIPIDLILDTTGLLRDAAITLIERRKG
jgi:hypothetical protein